MKTCLISRGAAKEWHLFEDSCLASQCALLPHDYAQASLHTRAREFGLSSVEAQNMSAPIGSMVATVPEVLTDISDGIEEKVPKGFPESDPVHRFWRGVRDLRDVHVVSEEAIGNIVPENWPDEAFPAGCARRLMAFGRGIAASTRA